MEKISNISSNIYNYFSKDQGINLIKQLSENQKLNIANELNTIMSETNIIDSKPELSLPRIVVIGTQSSGKSTVLNRIVGMEILPTGKYMVTRTPLNIMLYKLESTEKRAWVICGSEEDDNFIKIDIDIPLPTDEQIKQIRDYISIKTDELAGKGMNISDQCINLKIYSPYVPNLSLIDLPGLTMVAQVDKGQPKDIKERIESLVIKFIKHPKTIILAVMASRSDLETDLGLHLIKKYDSEGQRTIGVLTKPDLMSTGENIGNYLVDNISKNLMLTYGYYVLRNGSTQEMLNNDIIKIIDMEKTYFINHPEYNKNIYKDKIGINNLTNNLNKILIASITEMIPSVMTEVIALETKVNKKIETLGCSLPLTIEGKKSVLNNYVSNFNTKFQDSVESRGTVLNSGKVIKDIFINYRKNIKKINPFNDTAIYNPEYYKNVISSFEGNHMSFHIPPVQVLEAVMTDENLRPIINLKEPSLDCVDDICDALIVLLTDLTRTDEFSKYPPLANYIITMVVDEIISKSKMETKNKINELLSDEEAYIWTDSEEFKKVLNEVTINNFDIRCISNLLEAYYSSIIYNMAHTVPKIIMKNIVRNVEYKLLSYLIQNIVKDDKINLLKEDDKIEKQRDYYLDLKFRIDKIKKAFTNNII